MSGISKISDFALATKEAGGDNNMGTIFWMAPELLNTNNGSSFKSDIWSIGCLVMEMWSGLRPWVGEEMVAVMFKVRWYQLPNR